MYIYNKKWQCYKTLQHMHLIIAIALGMYDLHAYWNYCYVSLDIFIKLQI